jgi:hypothetical protein
VNVYAIEDAITNYTYEETYERTWGLNPGPVTVTRELGWHELWCESLPEGGVVIPGVGRVEVEARHGGEGQGDSAWVVVKITEPDGTERYLRKDGYYSSYDGADFDGLVYEVEPTEVLRIEYVEV